jgi:hypothetical protein
MNAKTKFGEYSHPVVGAHRSDRNFATLRVHQTPAPELTAAHEIERPSVFKLVKLESDRTPVLTKVVAFLVGVINHIQEDDIVRRYEGHSWCDSTERRLNYHIMTGRDTRL